jgi:quercetin dioxygenase-like cupin family protein
MGAFQSRAVLPGEGRVLRVLGNTFTIKVSSADASDRYAIFEIGSPPNGGIPPHVNTREAETHIVLEGRYRFLLGVDAHEAGPGGVFFAPPGVVHSFQNLGPGPGRMLLIPAPGSNNEAFVGRLAEQFGATLPASGPDPEMLKALAALAAQYGVEPRA